MRFVVSLEGEFGVHVCFHLRYFVDGCSDGLVNFDLEGLAFSRALTFLVRRFEEIFTAFFGGYFGDTCKGFVIHSGYINWGNIDFGRCRDSVGLVDTTEIDTIDFVRTCDEEETGSQLLQEHNAFASETSSQKDEDGTGSDVLSEFGRLRISLSDSQRFFVCPVGLHGFESKTAPRPRPAV